ncbi:cytochrome P450 [Kitasatospora sp. NPDC093102]|uniref:cytochrome P450 n=1 Tax=Kitasatospora sp. NPDC093102 TaxID=3155069 RepID=UPI003435CF55
MSTIDRAVHTAPGRLPLLGHALKLHRDPLAFLDSLQGQGEIVRIFLGPRPAYVLNDPELVHRILVAGDDSVDKGALFERARRVIGESLITSTGTAHRTRRRRVQPAFHRARIDRYLDAMLREADEATAGWEDGQQIDLGRTVNDLTLSVAARTLFTTRADDGTAERMAANVPVLFAIAATLTMLPSWWRRLPTPGNHRFDQASANVRAAVTDALARRRSGTDVAEGAAGDVLDILLASRTEDGGTPMSDREIQDEIITLVVTGAETTRALILATLHELGRHPEVADRMVAEMDSVIGTSPVRPEQLRLLEYTGHVIAETLRLYPNWLLTRRVLRPTKLGPVLAPAGTELIYSPYLLHRNPALYPDPDRFDPDRWLTGEKPRRGAFIPFGNGAHKCVGDHFALSEALAVLATIHRKWRLRPIAGLTPGLVAKAGPIYPTPLHLRAESRSRSRPAPFVPRQRA